MSDQIARDHERALAAYEYALLQAQRAIEMELDSIQECRRKSYRFNVRHALLDLAEAIQATDHKMKLFSNLCWEPLAKENQPRAPQSD